MESAALCAECLYCVVCSVFLSFLHHFSLSASSAKLWVSSTLSSSRACSAPLLAARQIRRRPCAVCKCGPLSTRIHHAFFHHIICLFDTSFSSCIEFTSFLASAHSFCVVVYSFPSCPSCASTSFLGFPFSRLSLSCSFWAFLSLLLLLSLHSILPLFLSLCFSLLLLLSPFFSLSLFLSPPLLSSLPTFSSPLPLAPCALSSLSRAPPACFLPFDPTPVVPHSSAPLALLLLPLALSTLPPLSLYLLLTVSCSSFSIPSPSSQSAHLIPRVSFFLLLPSLLLDCPPPLCFCSAHAHLTIGLISLSCHSPSKLRIYSFS